MINVIYDDFDYLDRYLWEQVIEQMVIVIFGILGVLLFCYLIRVCSNSYHRENDKKNEISDEELSKILDGYNVEALKKMAYERFAAILNALESFDYAQLRKLCSEALYQLYVTELDLLKRKKEKHIIGDFKNNEIRLIDVDDNGELYTFKFMVDFQYYDDIVKDRVKKESYTGIGGHHRYILEFILDKKIQDLIKCPNCGAPMQIVTSKKCEYCGSLLSVRANDFVLSKVTKFYHLTEK